MPNFMVDSPNVDLNKKRKKRKTQHGKGLSGIKKKNDIAKAEIMAHLKQLPKDKEEMELEALLFGADTEENLNGIFSKTGLELSTEKEEKKETHEGENLSDYENIQENNDTGLVSLFIIYVYSLLSFSLFFLFFFSFLSLLLI